MRAPLTWLDQQLSDGRNFLLGDNAGAIDAQIYYVIWFMRGRWDQGPSFLAEFTHLGTWEERVRAIGHGTMTDMSPEVAITRATACEPVASTGVAPGDPQGLKQGMAVVMSPDVDGGEQPVEGLVRAADHETIVLERTDTDAGTIAVHFPRAGYRVDVVAG